MDILKSSDGRPGELMGDFMNDPKELGTLTKNTQRGIYGKLNRPLSNSLYPEGVPGRFPHRTGHRPRDAFDHVGRRRRQGV